MVWVKYHEYYAVVPGRNGTTMIRPVPFQLVSLIHNRRQSQKHAILASAHALTSSGPRRGETSFVQATTSCLWDGDCSFQSTRKRHFTGHTLLDPSGTGPLNLGSTADHSRSGWLALSRYVCYSSPPPAYPATIDYRQCLY